ncbi:hypothetical protein BH11BAC3_BH11BAC3_24010 [soil metagenome]
MKNKIVQVFAGVLIIFFSVISCKKNNVTPALSVANITDTIPPEGGNVSLAFTSSDAWSIDTTGIGWLQLSQASGNSGDASITLTAPANTTGINRSILLQLNAANGLARRVTVLQAPVIFTSYNTSPKAPDATGMGSTAMQINSSIKLGMNIWNTMEASGGETGWGNPLITQSLIDTLKKAGFNAIRIPVQYWTSHTNHQTGEIDAAWLNRVKEVVQYCVNDDMYVLLNIHWDGGFLDCKATGAKLDTIKAIQKVLWEQIATKMRDFGEHVMYASANEPDATDLTSSSNLYSFHQIFINTVRATGGKNAYRTLVIQAPGTSLDLANYFGTDGLPGMPKDPVPDKLILEFHWYSPPNFCLLTSDASWGKEWRFWGANFHSPTDLIHNSVPGTEEGWLDSTMQWANKHFVSKNIPMLMGEFGAENHAVNIIGNPQDSILSLNSRAHFFKFLVERARANGVSPFLWAGIIDRQTERINDKQALDSLRVGAGL